MTENERFRPLAHCPTHQAPAKGPFSCADLEEATGLTWSCWEFPHGLHFQATHNHDSPPQWSTLAPSRWSTLALPTVRVERVGSFRWRIWISNGCAGDSAVIGKRAVETKREFQQRALSTAAALVRDMVDAPLGMVLRVQLEKATGHPWTMQLCEQRHTLDFDSEKSGVRLRVVLDDTTRVSAISSYPGVDVVNRVELKRSRDIDGWTPILLQAMLGVLLEGGEL